MDIKQLNKLLGEIQNLHNTKVEINKEMQSGQMQLEAAIKRREELYLTSTLKESDVRKAANELVLRASKFFFASKPQFIPAPAETRLTSPSSPSRRAQSPKKMAAKPFLCGVSSPKKKEILSPLEASPHVRSQTASELIEIKKEADTLLQDFYMKYPKC
jgi:hypothetical protein